MGLTGNSIVPCHLELCCIVYQLSHSHFFWGIRFPGTHVDLRQVAFWTILNHSTFMEVWTFDGQLVDKWKEFLLWIYET